MGMEQNVFTVLQTMQLDKIQNSVANVSGRGEIIVDFDHTLWLGNSTEQFIETVKPRILGELLDAGAKFLWRYLGAILPMEKDQFRVFVVTLFAPWSWLIWWSKSKGAVARYWNQTLFDLVTTTKKPVLIVSHGFEPIIRPLLKAKFPKGSDTPSLVASGLLLKSKSVRQQGKICAIERKVPTISWSDTFVVSDSIEDHDLLAKAKYSVLTCWEEPEKTLPPGYFPMRYVGQGKYPGWGYAGSSILGKDLVVWLILYTPTLNAFIPALLLFFSFQVIYEIGHYENDFMAAKKEETPTLAKNYRQFTNYNISLWAWMWAVVMGMAGCYLYLGGWELNIMVAWLGLLLFLRTVFYIYNKITPQSRITLYLVLQSIKSFAGLVVIFPTLVGILLAIAHIFQHATAYIIYRCQGDRKLFPRAIARMVVFLMGIAIVVGLNEELSLVHLAVASFWVSLTVIIENMGGLEGLRRVFSNSLFPKKKLL